MTCWIPVWLTCREWKLGSVSGGGRKLFEEHVVLYSMRNILYVFNISLYWSCFLVILQLLRLQNNQTNCTIIKSKKKYYNWFYKGSPSWVHLCCRPSRDWPGCYTGTDWQVEYVDALCSQEILTISWISVRIPSAWACLSLWVIGSTALRRTRKNTAGPHDSPTEQTALIYWLRG